MLGPECPISIDVLGGKEDTQGCPQVLLLLEESRRKLQPFSAFTLRLEVIKAQGTLHWAEPQTDRNLKVSLRYFPA